MNWFGIIRPIEVELCSILDAVVFLANPSEKLPAHITVRGPCDSQSKALGTNSSSCYGSLVHVLGAGHFFSSGQATVFLKVDSDFLKSYWYKPDFPYNPHITLYDGNDFDFACKLYNIVNEKRLFFAFQSSGLIAASSVKGQSTLDLSFDLDSNFLKSHLGQHVDNSYIRKLNDGKRLYYIQRILDYFFWVLHKPKTSDFLADSMVSSWHRQHRPIQSSTHSHWKIAHSKVQQ